MCSQRSVKEGFTRTGGPLQKEVGIARILFKFGKNPVETLPLTLVELVSQSRTLFGQLVTVIGVLFGKEGITVRAIPLDGRLG